MGAERENADIWWSLGFFWDGRWRGWRLLHRHFWRNPYVWHDSFGARWNRWVVCPLRGHRKVQDVGDPGCGEPSRMYCFNCEQDVDPAP